MPSHPTVFISRCAIRGIVLILAIQKISSQPHYEWSVGGRFKTCPFYKTDHWIYLETQKNCKGNTTYHCLKDKEGNWIELCDEVQICSKGQEPQVIENRVKCAFCRDPERYNPYLSTPSNEMSRCQREKTNCSAEKMLICEPEYDKDDPDSSYKMDRVCRCNHEQNWVPTLENVICIEAQHLHCTKILCNNTTDGIQQKLGSDYLCHPDLNSSTAAPTAILTTDTTKNKTGNTLSTEIPSFNTSTTVNPTDGKDLVAYLVLGLGIPLILIFGFGVYIIIIKCGKPPGSLDKCQSTGTTVTLSWSPISRKRFLPKDYKYELDCQIITQGRAGKWEKTVETEDTNFTVTDLSPGTRYKFRVRVVYRFMKWTIKSKSLHYDFIQTNSNPDGNSAETTFTETENRPEGNATTSAVSVNLTDGNGAATTSTLTENVSDVNATKSTVTDNNSKEALQGTPRNVKWVFKQVINQTCVELKESLAENTIDYMAEASMGNQGQRNTINDTKTSSERNDAILRLVLSQGFEYGYEKFKRVLHKSEQMGLLQLLVSKENELLKQGQFKRGSTEAKGFDMRNYEREPLLDNQNSGAAESTAQDNDHWDDNDVDDDVDDDHDLLSGSNGNR